MSVLRPFARPALTAALVAALGGTPVGCKWFGGGKDSEAAPKTAGDPLLGMRIPPQDVPTRDRGSPAGGKRDPLMTTPAGRRPRPDSDALPPRTSNDPGRPPYRPSTATTPAALAGFAPDADLDLNRRPAKPDGDSTGPVPLKPVKLGTAYDKLAAQLKAAGATLAGPTKTGSEYTLRATVPTEGDPPGSRSYDGVGATAVAAAESALEQIQADRGK